MNMASFIVSPLDQNLATIFPEKCRHHPRWDPGFRSPHHVCHDVAFRLFATSLHLNPSSVTPTSLSRLARVSNNRRRNRFPPRPRRDSIAMPTCLQKTKFASKFKNFFHISKRSLYRFCLGASVSRCLVIGPWIHVIASSCKGSANPSQ